MEPTEKSESYPVFEPNQILSDAHLNQARDYLDEQERLTRANLIGVGIVCGLEIRLDGNSIVLSKGCGVTSEGYLIVESEDVSLVSYRQYKLPGDPDYPSFKDSSSPPVQYPLWELFPAGEPDTMPLETPANFLNDKAVLLFLELKKEGLRNCSPNNCDDKGTKVTATVRRLLVGVSDLGKIIAEANSLQSGLSSDELEKTLLARLNLPDLRLPRYDVPNKRAGTTEQVLAAFLSVFSPKIVKDTGNALSSAYEAFKPLLKKKYPTDPFSGFSGKFGFLESMPENEVQVLFLQYYYDLFGDLIKAYNEFRWKGAELLCSCCPPDKLCPRHLMLGVLDENSEKYRQKFLASPAVSRCEGHVKELKQLFQRIVTMIDSFTDEPPMPKATSSVGVKDEQIRITPSKLGDVPLSDKAIPYYYKLPMYLYWDPEKTRHGREKQNLSYRSYEYNPPAPDALSFDLEPYNFLRVEGHLGKDYQKVLERLIYLKDIYRLPIEIIALRTGDFDKDIAVNLSKEKCRFQDLEAMYDVQREEILSTLCEGTMYLYDIQTEGVANLPGGKPQLPLLRKYAPNFLYKDGTIGAWYEKYLTLFKSISYIDVDQNKIDAGALFGVYCILFMNTVPPDPKYQPHIVSIYYFTKLAEVLPASLDALGYADFENKYQDLMGLIRYFRSDAVAKISAEFQKFIPLEDLIDHFDQVLFSCKLEPVKAIHDEYESRLREIKQKHFLSFFLQKQPGIQHKAGVPLGGTFIIVYHQNPAPDRILDISPDVKKDNQRVRVVSDTESMTPLAGDTQMALTESIKRIASNTDLASNPDVKMLVGLLTDWVAVQPAARPGSSDRAFEIISKVVGDLNEGTVIADFFLPYLCCSDCSPVQFILQKIPPTFTAQIGCTNSDNRAEVTIVPKGGEAPYDYKLDEQPFLAFIDKIIMSSGPHTLIIRDNAGVESVPQSLRVPEPLAIGAERYTEDVPAQTYTVSFNIIGGNPTYNTDSGTITNDIFNSVPVTSGKPISVTIIDSAGCKVNKEFTHVVCKLPCDGKSMRCAYRLWLQPPFEGATYKSYQQEGKIRFRFNGEDIEIAGSDTLLKIPTLELNNNFHDAIAGAIKNMNAAIKRALTERFGADLGKNRLVLAYEPSLSDPFGILWIEYFECEKFTVEFDFLFSKPDTGFSLTMRYTNEQAITSEAVLINRRLENKETRVPAFDCSERNQCLGSEYKKLCDGPDPKTEVTIDPNGENRFIFAGKVNNMPETEIIGWVWDAPIAQPTEPFYAGKKVEAQLLKPGGIVRLTAIAKKGCFSFVQENIEQ